MYSRTWSVPHRTDVVKLACRTTLVQNLDSEFHDPTDSLVADTGSRTDMVSKRFFFLRKELFKTSQLMLFTEMSAV